MKAFLKLAVGLAAIVTVLTGQASAVVYVNETFSYIDGPITNGSSGVWTAFSGAVTAPVNITNGHAITSGFLTQDVGLSLAGGPTASNTVLYASFDLWLDALPLNTSTYFFNFKDNTTANFVGRLFAVTNTTTVGQYRVGMSINAGSAGGIYAQDIALGATNKVVVKWDSTATTSNLYTLWLNPTSEGDPSVTISGTGLLNLPIYQVALRQSTNAGIENIDNLMVGDSFSVVVPEPSTIALVGMGLVGAMAFSRRRKFRK